MADIMRGRQGDPLGANTSWEVTFANEIGTGGNPSYQTSIVFQYRDPRKGGYKSPPTPPSRAIQPRWSLIVRRWGSGGYGNQTVWMAHMRWKL